MPDEPKHPTYGMLKELLAEIERDVRQGYELRIGLHGALLWFADEFGRLRSIRREQQEVMCHKNQGARKTGSRRKAGQVEKLTTSRMASAICQPPTISERALLDEVMWWYENCSLHLPLSVSAKCAALERTASGKGRE